jgi:hypothetical protein
VASAPAKLNLFLHVLGRRADGYHELQTLFQLVDLCDELRLEVTRDGQVTRELADPAGPLAAVPPGEDLVVRAARLLQQRGGVALGARIRITKRIPLGGGLGGGSSDAAAVLRTLNTLWDLHLPPDELATLALTVTPAASFVVSVSPVQMDVQQGSTTSVTVNISRLNLFSGPVARMASGVPAGVTASFNPQSTTGDQSTLTFTASAGAVPNTYQVTITGTGGTPTAQSSANLTLIVLGSAASLEGRVVSITP